MSVEVQTQIMIGLTPDGRVICQAQGNLNRFILEGMINVALVDLRAKLAPAPEPGIAVAPPGFRIPDPGRG